MNTTDSRLKMAWTKPVIQAVAMNQTASGTAPNVEGNSGSTGKANPPGLGS